MESVNNSPKEFRKTLWQLAVMAGGLGLLWRLPELITAIHLFIK